MNTQSTFYPNDFTSALQKMGDLLTKTKTNPEFIIYTMST